MTVTIISAPPQSKQTATVDVSPGSDSPDSGVDFASLLLGQLQPVAPQKIADTRADDAEDKPDTGSVDAASILATLIPPSEPGRQAGDIAESSSNKDTALSALNAVDRSRSGASATEQAKQVSERNADAPAVLETQATSDKPAKLAAVAQASAETPLPAAKNTSEDVAPPPSSLSASHAMNHPNHAVANRDAPLAVNTPFHDQNWSTDFGQKIVWLASNDKQSAQITLNPPQMGPIEVSITVDKGNATASFVSPSSDVREAIETALPRLREMFANAGIQLGQTNVGAESFRQQASGGGADYGASRQGGGNVILAADSIGSASARAFGEQRGNSMVDLFA